MNPEPEIRHLLDLMPASGRMLTTIVSKPEQRQVITSPFPLPWNRQRPIYINFNLWRRLPRPQRDLLLLRTMNWLVSVKWFKPDLLRGLAVIGALGTLTELTQGDAIGLIAAAGLTGIAGLQIWRNSQSARLEVDADEAAVQVAQRRGYTEIEAARHLLAGIESAAQLEERLQLSFTELIRCQNLRAIAGLSPVGIPETLKQE